MEQIVFLSHELNSRTPAYNNTGGFVRKTASAIANGNSANSEHWQFNNHLGTHMDFPLHFNNDGKSLSDYEPSFFWLNKVAIIKTTVTPGEVITPDYLEDLLKDHDSDLQALFLDTGFEKYRFEMAYWDNSPGFHPDLYNLFRTKFPGLRFFGFDAISLTSLKHRDMGREAHRKFLLNNDPVLIIEDVSFSNCPGNCEIKETIISPLQVTGADGGPVSIVSKIMV